MTRGSGAALRVLHAVRTTGYADTARIAARAGVDADTAAAHLADAQASGWVALARFAGDQGWSMTERGRVHGERLLAAELDAAARAEVVRVHGEFLPHNDVVAGACTAWQLAELGLGGRTLAETLAALEVPAAALRGFEARLTAHLTRFAGYHGRFAAALAASRTDPRWITGTDRDSCHRVWFELHEDLIATLGLTR